MNSSREFAIAFRDCVGGNIYVDTSNPDDWVVELDGHIFSESGLGVKDKLIPYVETLEISDEVRDKYCPIVNEIYKRFTIVNDRKIITRFLSMFPDYSEVTKFDGRGCVLFNQRFKKKFYLKILRKSNVIETVSYVIAIHRQLSGLGLAPPLYLSGHMEEYGYLVMEYLPTTAGDLVKRGLFTKEALITVIMKLVKTIHDLQIYNLDVHWKNFLYDGQKNIIYMIDFNDAKIDPTDGYDLEDHYRRLLSGI